MNNADLPATGFHSPECGTSHGLTKREAFAMAAMQGVLSNGGLMNAINAGTQSPKHAEETLALNALRYADALIAELAKGRP